MSERGKDCIPVYNLFPISEKAAVLAAGRLVASFCKGNYLPYEAAKLFVKSTNPPLFDLLRNTIRSLEEGCRPKSRYMMLGGLYTYGALCLHTKIETGCLPPVSPALANTVRFEFTGLHEQRYFQKSYIQLELIPDIVCFEERESGLMTPVREMLSTISPRAAATFIVGQYLTYKLFQAAVEVEKMRAMIAVPVK